MRPAEVTRGTGGVSIDCDDVAALDALEEEIRRRRPSANVTRQLATRLIVWVGEEKVVAAAAWMAQRLRARGLEVREEHRG